MTHARSVVAALVLLPFLSAPASAQVAFQPVIGAFPNGVTLSATPVVSADRRYVRLGMNPQFTGLIGFNTYSVPAAVSGGGVGGGFRSVDQPGTAFGMDGPVGADDTYGSGDYGRGAGAGPDFSPTASPAASALLAGGPGYSGRSRLAADPPRPKATPGTSRVKKRRATR